MKLNKLKNINIGSINFKITWDRKTGGGSFSYSEKQIVIGTELGEENAFQVLVHELKEIIQVEQSTRYDKKDEHNNFMFFYSHAEHTELCARLSEYLLKFIK